MRYVQTIKSHLLPFAQEYWAILQEAFWDINAYIDECLECNRKTQYLIAGIIATPLIGMGWFFLLLMVSF